MLYPYIKYFGALLLACEAAVLLSWTAQLIDPGLTHLNACTSALTEMGRAERRLLGSLASSITTRFMTSSSPAAIEKTPTITYGPETSTP